MRMRSFAAPAVPLALMLFFPGAALGKHAATYPPTSQPQGFWHGDQVPTFEAELIHSALTNPDGGPIRKLMEAFENEDLNPPPRAVRLQPGHDGSKAWPGYTLISSLITGPVLVDMNGNVVKSWPTLSAFPAKMLPGGSVMGYSRAGRQGNQDYQALLQQSWCGVQEWSWNGAAPGEPMPEGGAKVHHDYQREGSSVGYYAPGQNAIVDGYAAKTWLLVHREPDPADTTHISDLLGLEDDAIIEVNPDGTIAWEWNAWKHVDQMGFDALAREAIRTVQVPVPASLGGGFPETDWQHVNAASHLGPNKWYEAGDERFHPDNILWDGRSSNIIAIIARHDDPRGRWAEGDIVWRTGPNYGVGHPENQLGQIIGQHTAHMIPAGLPGAGNILVFDNGGLAGFGSLLPGAPAFWPVKFRSYSRALEYDPITFEKVWEYTNETDDRSSGGDRKFMSWFISSTQRLKNGNTLIAEGHHGRVFEVTGEGEIVWEYFQPRLPAPYDFYPPLVYRAYRYPASFLPANTACP